MISLLDSIFSSIFWIWSTIKFHATYSVQSFYKLNNFEVNPLKGAFLKESIERPVYINTLDRRILRRNVKGDTKWVFFVWNTYLISWVRFCVQNLESLDLTVTPPLSVHVDC